MRVTDSMIWNSMQRSVAARQTDYAKAQQRATSGKQVSQPSDDPSAFAQARAETGNLNRAQNYERAISLAKPILETADSALTNIENIMGRVRDIAIQGANDPLNGNDRNTLSQELGTLKDQLVTLANSHSGDRYVFAGYKDDAPPFDATGTYNGSTDAQKIEVERGVTMPLSVTGDAVFGAAGADVFTTITNLQTALTSNNGANVSAQLPDIDTRFDQIRATHSQVGLYQNEADIAETVSTRAQDAATESRSKLVDIDAAEAYTDLTKAQTALAAAIQIAGQLPPPGLVSRSR